mgnify:CR=1 FL=1
MFVALVENLPKILEALVEACGKIIEAILEAIGKGFSKMAEAGLNLVKGLWQGIKDAASWLKNKIAGWVDDVIGAIKGFFGINSPSKVTAEDGKYLVMGLGKGITEKLTFNKCTLLDLGKALASYDNGP